MHTCHRPRKTIITLALSTVILLNGPSLCPAFKGMGSQGGGESTAEPQKQVEEAIDRHGIQSETVIATINGEPVTMAELMTNIKTLMLQKYKGLDMTDDLARRIRYTALEQLAMEELAFQRAQAIGAVPPEQEVEARLEKMIAAAGGRENFTEALAEKGKTIADIREEITRYLAVKNAIEHDIDSKIETDENEVKRLYQEKKDTFASQEKVTVTDIIFFLDPEDKKSREKVGEVRNRLVEELDGKVGKLEQDSFFAVQNGINVSENHKKEVYQLAREMEPGTVSQPVTIDGTLHLVKLDYYQPRKEADPERVRSYLQQKLRKAEKERLLTQWRQELMDNADIEIQHELLKEFGK